MADNIEKSHANLSGAKKSFESRVFDSREFSGIGLAGTMRLLKGRFSKFINYLGRSVAYTSVRSYGCFALAFGLMTLFLHLGEYYFAENPSIIFSSLIIGAVLTIVGIPLLFFDKPMCIALQDMAVTDFLFFEFFSIKRMHRINDSSSPVPPVLALFLGFIPAVIAFFVPPYIVLLVLVLSAALIVAFISPEFPMIFSLLVLPYTFFIPNADVVLAILSAVSFVSFGGKVILGKRVYNFRIYDAVITFIFVMMLVSGIVSSRENSFVDSVLLVAIMHGYFPAANLIVNRRLADCAVNALTVSSVPVCILAIIEFFIELPGGVEPPSYSTPGISSVFENQPALASFLLICGVFTFGFAQEKTHRGKKIAVYGVFALILATLLLTLDVGVLVAIVFALFAYAAITTKKIPVDLALIFVVIAHLVFLIPAGFLDTISTFFGMERSFSELLSGASVGLGTFLSNALIGVGAGSEQAAESNLLLGVGVAFGASVLIAFVLLIVLRLRHISYYRTFVRNSPVKTTLRMSQLALVCILVYGAYYSVLSEISILYVFSVTFGIGTAMLNIAKNEHDDRMGYYGQLTSFDSAELDVALR